MREWKKKNQLRGHRRSLTLACVWKNKNGLYHALTSHALEKWAARATSLELGLVLILHSLSPGWPSEGCCFPVVLVNVQGLYEFSIEEVFGDPSIVSMRMTWPSQRIRLCFSSVNMLVHPALSRTVSFGTLSCQVMFRMRRRLRMWKALSFRSCRARNVQDSLPYRRVCSRRRLCSLWIFVCSGQLAVVRRFLCQSRLPAKRSWSDLIQSAFAW